MLCEAGKELGPVMRLNSRITAMALMAALTGFATVARADDDHDHDMARQAVERGEIKPLAEICGWCATSSLARSPA